MAEKSLALIGNASGQGAEGARNCSEAFSIRRLEGRRWQWWALLWSCGRDSASVKRGEESGNERRERLLCEVGMRGRGNFAICAQTGTGDKAVVLWFGRSCAKTCRHTFESDWIGLGS